MNYKIIAIVGVFVMSTINAVQLPKSTGQFLVGTTTYHWIDTKRKETLGDHPNRELMVQVWYPAQTTGKKSDYMSPTLRAYIARNADYPYSLFEFGYTTKQVLTNSFEDVPVSDAKSHYPVVIFSHGFGAPRYLYTSLLEDLASRGYIVVAPSHTYASDPVEFPDGRITQAADVFRKNTGAFKRNEETRAEAIALSKVWIGDIQFVADMLEQINHQDSKGLLTGKLDMQHLGLFGHSFGGFVTEQLCRMDKRFKAGVDIDGDLIGYELEQGFDTPFMCVYVAAGMPSKEELARMGMTEETFRSIVGGMENKIKTLCNAIPNDTYQVKCKTAHHMTFSDYFLINPFGSPEEQGKVIDPQRGVAMTRALLGDFFDRYLKGQTSVDLLDNASQNIEIVIKA
ncbi:MAG: hypothetical protein NTX86_05225 [Candidatus Dependentiae bacterium]|nr:hypothetical protein [Candidatus Dependentiae bacterium]